MNYVPHEYQDYAKDFILEHPACGLFLDLGLGKTVITLTAIIELLFDYFEVAKVLVIAPLRVAQDTWSRECEKWDHLRHIKISKVLGTEKERRLALHRKADIYIINRENVEWLVKYHRWDFDMVIVDELSSFKSPSSKRFKSLRKVRPNFKRVVGLTGTPAPNSLLDLWSQINLLDRGERLGRFIGNYRRDYFEPDKRNKQVIFSYKLKADAEEAIYKKLSDICVSMKARDYLEMPKRVDNRIEVSMSEQEMALYKQLEREMLLPFKEGDIDAVNAAALSNKLLQMANGAVYDENRAVRLIHHKKLDALEDLVEASNGKPVLIFYGYIHDRDRIAERFKVSEIKTSEDIEVWNQGEIEIAVAHPAAVGHGLNLQAGGSTIIWFGLTWSLELYQQANARLWRQGQKDTVVIHHIITKGTIDEQVMKALERKHIGQKALIDAVRARVGGRNDEC
ncbi:DEAD/DEAH box helicase [Desulfosporosinus sp.]|uniref:DEAD/DEAH box helicase n=1 Tax=Desulfosporosinus sp. TaxID=157907 RepID=UPI0025C5C777|nr:DEAD/DEAH box helicase [Desulfosporosinus sp.]MBC2723238.1 DEAD/DEAH box helicase [Desulfosporosinus sp.]MBC2727113.1 DEAD/DEAH box helicase [Desulfosporosinus sp.]